MAGRLTAMTGRPMVVWRRVCARRSEPVVAQGIVGGRTGFHEFNDAAGEQLFDDFGATWMQPVHMPTLVHTTAFDTRTIHCVLSTMVTRSNESAPHPGGQEPGDTCATRDRIAAHAHHRGP